MFEPDDIRFPPAGGVHPDLSDAFDAQPTVGAQPELGEHPDVGAQTHFTDRPTGEVSLPLGDLPAFDPLSGHMTDLGSPRPVAEDGAESPAAEAASGSVSVSETGGDFSGMPETPDLSGDFSAPQEEPETDVWQEAEPYYAARGGRYIYHDLPDNPPPPATPRPKRQDGFGVAVIVSLVLVALCLVTVLIRSVLFSSDSSSDSGAPKDSGSPHIFGGPDSGDDSGDAPRDDGTPWGGIRPGDGDTKQGSDNQLPRAEPDDSLTLEVRSAEGKTALSYQELYTLCLPSTVSITVYDNEGGGGTGTGIIMTEDGYILTCQHVVEDGVSCTVTTWDDQVYDALLVGADAQTDLAVLKIDAEGLRPAEFGDSDELTVGDEALAIGDPLGVELRGTLTNGIISAINRNVVMNSYSMTLLQTTAALNSGNSGGPLINIYGQVVGVNNMKMVSDDVTVEGLGFAVPTSVVRDIVPVLAAEGKVSRPVLGITCYGIDAETAERQDYPTKGLLVASINPASNAGESGLREGDYIFAVEGQEVVSVEEVKAILADKWIGDELELTVLREREDKTLEELHITVTLVDQAELK